jgi:NAD(P)-dependent dehydrogenase (short-subunit alcohol dehydrogenase family)
MSEMRFEGRAALITGAGSGLGLRYAQLLAGRGAGVVVHDTDADAAVQAAREIESQGGVALAQSGSLDTPEGAQSAIEAAGDRFGGVDIVLLQAIPPTDGSAHGSFADTDPDELLAELFEGYWVTRAAWAPMRERGYGRIVLTCPLGRPIADAMDPGNTVSNMGLMGVMNILKCEGPEHDMMVNMVAPSPAGDAAAVADLAAYLAHETCRTTGEIFTVQSEGVARMFMGVNAGFFDAGLTLEGVRDHLGVIMDPATFIVPDEAGQEIQQLLLGHLR